MAERFAVSPPTGRLLLRAFRRWEQDVLSALESLGHEELGLSHGHVLSQLDRPGQRITQIARESGLTKQAIGQIVRDLARRGLVVVGEDPEDRRAKVLSCTPQGAQLVAAMSSAVELVEGRFADAMGPKSYAITREGLKALLADD